MIQFRIQGTPNPNARKYITDQNLKADGKVSYKDPAECTHIPMAREILEIIGIKQVHLFDSSLTVTQDGSIDWADLDQVIQEIVMEHIDNHDANFADSISFEQDEQPRKELNGDLLRIDEILEATLRPALQMDGGDVEVLALEGNILTLRYLGACGGCPSASAGTLEAIRMTLRQEFREDLEVVTID